MSQVLYRKWRPRAFRDLVGQPSTAKTLTRAVSGGRLAHAYLFCGPRGTGKTSTARILAKAMNCLSPADGEPDNACEICMSIDEGRAMDLFEIDAASNRGIDDIRELRERVQFSPAQARIKVYIVDEAHMLTAPAFNALLKTLEEPPAHVAFVLATTESHKIPPTIVSRCQRFDFRRITLEDIAQRLDQITQSEGSEVAPGALLLLARAAEGGMRDAVNLLEQAIVSYDSPITDENVRDMLDMGDDEASMTLATQILEGRTAEALRTVGEVAAQGTDLRQLHRGLVDRLRAVMLVSSGGELGIGFGEEETEQLRSLAGSIGPGAIVGALRRLTETDLRGELSTTLPLELAVAELGLTPTSPNGLDEQAAVVAPAKTQVKPKSQAPPKPAPESATSAPSRPAPPPPAPSPAVPAQQPQQSPPEPMRMTGLPSEPQERLEVQWNAIVESLRRTKGGRFNLKALLRATATRKVVDEKIFLTFTHPSHEERMREELDLPPSRKIIEDVFEQAMGGRYHVEIAGGDQMAPVAQPQPQVVSQLVEAARSRGAQQVGETVAPNQESETQT